MFGGFLQMSTDNLDCDFFRSNSPREHILSDDSRIWAVSMIHVSAQMFNADMLDPKGLAYSFALRSLTRPWSCDISNDCRPIFIRILCIFARAALRPRHDV